MKRIFYKYKKIDEYLYDMLTNHYFYLAHHHQLNDDMEGKIYTTFKNVSDEEIIKYMEEKRFCISVEKFRKLRLDEYIDKTGICSFTVLKNDELMWKNYGGNHLGVILGYEADCFDNGFLFRVESHEDWDGIMNRDKQVEYRTRFPDAPREDHVPILEVKYDKTGIPITNFIDKDLEKEAIKKAFLTKTRDWSHEKEYRIVLPANKENPNRKLYYQKNVLKEIIFGNKIPLDEIKKIKKILDVSEYSEIKYNME